MIGIARKLLRLVTGHSNWLLLLAVAAVGAGLYAWGAEGRADRDRLIAWGEKTCAAAGAEFQPARGKRGAACFERARDLARFRHDAAIATADALARNEQDRARRSADDAAAARRDAQAASAAVTRMEAANAEIVDDRVGAAWLGAWNDLAGLRARRPAREP